MKLQDMFQMLRLIDYLLSNLGVDPRITGMSIILNLDNPLANPDGHIMVEQLC